VDLLVAACHLPSHESLASVEVEITRPVAASVEEGVPMSDMTQAGTVGLGDLVQEMRQGGGDFREFGRAGADMVSGYWADRLEAALAEARELDAKHNSANHQGTTSIPHERLLPLGPRTG